MAVPVAQWKGFAYTILPTLTLAIGSIAGKTRNMRTLMLEVISETTSRLPRPRASPLPGSSGATRSATPSSHDPLPGMEIVTILMGSFVVEQIFAIPGIGAYFVQSIQSLDYTMTLA